MKDVEASRSMTNQYHEELAGREFKDALFSVVELRAWLTKSGKEFETVPPLSASGFIQVEALLCGIERAAYDDYPEATARAIVGRNAVLSVHDLAAEAPQWLIGAERHAAWRSELRAAIERGELILRDPVTKLRVSMPTDAANGGAPAQRNGSEQSGTPSASPTGTASRVDVQTNSLKIGSNSKATTDAHIERRSREIFADGDASTMQMLAERIAEELKAKGIRGERGTYLTWQTVAKAIPPGLTGGRRRNGRNKPK